MVNSKNKGNTAERKLASILQSYIGGSFQRVPSSGSFIGGKNASRKQFLSETQIRASKSDIIPPDEYSRLVIECKSYKDFSYSAFATSQDIPLLDKWLSELEYDCDDDDIGILCFKTNNKKWSIAMNVSYKDHFKLSIFSMYKLYFVTGLETFLTDNKESFIQLIKE